MISGARHRVDRITVLKKKARDALFRGRYRVSSRYRRPAAPVPMRSLVSPLRYDIVVRAEFFAFLDRQAAGSQVAVDDLVEQARSMDYHPWFRSIAAHHIGVASESSERAMEVAFRQRVMQSLDLWESFRRSGYDRRGVVTLAHHDPCATATGKKLSARLQPLDGCHRLALLLNAGVAELDPNRCWVIDSSVPAIDNTATLLGVLGIGEERYFRFLSMGYLDHECGSRDGFLAALKEQPMEVQAEVDNLIASDDRFMAGPSGRS